MNYREIPENWLKKDGEDMDEEQYLASRSPLEVIAAELLDKEHGPEYRGSYCVGLSHTVEEGQLIPDGSMNIQILQSVHGENEVLLVVYRPKEFPILFLPLDGKTRFSFSFSKRITKLAISDISISIMLYYLEGGELDLVPVLMLFCPETKIANLEDNLPESPDAVVVDVGWNILTNETVWSCVQGRVRVKYLYDVEHIISNDSGNWTSILRGMHVGHHRIVRRGDCVVVVKLQKAERYADQTTESEREQNSEVEVEKEREMSPVETVADAETEAHDKDVETTIEALPEETQQLVEFVTTRTQTELITENMEQIGIN